MPLDDGYYGQAAGCFTAVVQKRFAISRDGKIAFEVNTDVGVADSFENLEGQDDDSDWYYNLGTGRLYCPTPFSWDGQFWRFVINDAPPAKRVGTR